MLLNIPQFGMVLWGPFVCFYTYQRGYCNAWWDFFSPHFIVDAPTLDTPREFFDETSVVEKFVSRPLGGDMICHDCFGVTSEDHKSMGPWKAD